MACTLTTLRSIRRGGGRYRRPGLPSTSGSRPPSRRRDVSTVVRHLHRETLLLKLQKCTGIAHSLSSEPVQLCLLPLIAQLLGLGQLPVTESREYHAPRS